MKKSWTLHILAHSGHVAGGFPTYTLGIRLTAQGSEHYETMPSVHHRSWHHLSKALAAVGIEESQLIDLKSKLEDQPVFEIHEVLLDEADIQRLGFTPQQVPPIAFS